MHFQHEHAIDEQRLGHHQHRARRNVFFDMLEDFSDTVNGEDGSDEEDDEEEEEEEETGVAASNSESVESTTARFGRFISPLAFNKISETLGEFYCVKKHFYKSSCLFIFNVRGD